MDTIKWFFSSFKWMLRWMKITIKRDPQVAVAILSILFVCVCLAVGSYLYCDFKERERKNEKREQEIRSEQGKTGKAYQDEVVHLRAELLAAQNQNMMLIKRAEYKDSVYYEWVKYVTKNGKK